MNGDRREFLKVAGLGAAGLGCSLTALARAAGGDAVAGVGAKRWALVVDTRACATRPGCDACIRACHGAHNVPDVADPRRAIQWLRKAPCERVLPEVATAYAAPELHQRPLLVTCNHCNNPPCVRVCPTQATFRRDDGVVMMDPHRCVGCRYCVVACPYGARSFNWQDPRLGLVTRNAEYPTRTKGVVEKCTLCEERLAAGQLPLCVDACRATGAAALVFGDLGDLSSEVSLLVRSRLTLRRRPELGTEPHVFYIA